MEKYIEAVYSFINKMKYLSNPNVLGIIVHGSYLTGYSHNKSDIDMLVIMKNNISDIIRAATIEQSFKIEYFEKPISDLYLSAENDFNSQSNALLAIVGHGRIILERGHSVSKLREFILEKYSKPLPPLEQNSAIELAVIIDNRILYLEKMFNNNSPEFMHNCHLVVEKIRKFYSRLGGCPDIPVVKSFRIYTDKTYRDSFSKGIIPEQSFISLYFTAVKCEDKNNMLSLVKKLYEYCIKDLNVDPNNYRIKILSRNDSKNKIHE